MAASGTNSFIDGVMETAELIQKSTETVCLAFHREMHPILLGRKKWKVLE